MKRLHKCAVYLGIQTHVIKQLQHPQTEEKAMLAAHIQVSATDVSARQLKNRAIRWLSEQTSDEKRDLAAHVISNEIINTSANLYVGSDIDFETGAVAGYVALYEDEPSMPLSKTQKILLSVLFCALNPDYELSKQVSSQYATSLLTQRHVINCVDWIVSAKKVKPIRSYQIRRHAAKAHPRT